MPETKDFVYRVVEHSLIRWFTNEAGDVMASNTAITERIAECGEEPPTFCRFRGRGVVDVETVLGCSPATFEFDIPGATTIEEALAGIDAAEKSAQPGVVEAAKEQARAQYDKLRSRIALPGVPPSGRLPINPPGHPGPSGLINPGS